MDMSVLYQIHTVNFNNNICIAENIIKSKIYGRVWEGCKSNHSDHVL